MQDARRARAVGLGQRLVRVVQLVRRVDAAPIGGQFCRAEQRWGAGNLRQFVRDDIPEHVSCHNDIERPGLANDLHAGGVNVTVAQFHIGVVLCHLNDLIVPEHTGRKHVRLVQAAHAAGAAAGFGKGGAGGQFHSFLVVILGVAGFAAMHAVPAIMRACQHPAADIPHNEDTEALFDQFRAQG